MLPPTAPPPDLIVFSTLCLFSSSASLRPLLPSSHCSFHRPPISALVSLVSCCPPHVTQPLSSLVLLFFVPSCFRILAAFVVVVRSLPMFPLCTGMPVSHKCSRPLVFWRYAGPSSPLQLLSTRSLRPVLFGVPLPLSVFPSPHNTPPRYTKLSP